MDNLNQQPVVNSYCGYLNQSEFAERYLFIENRIIQGISREELAFLLGRVPYFITDYEELSTSKLELADIDLIKKVFERHQYKILNFDSKDGKYDISNERRQVRVVRRKYNQNIVYEFYHPWKIDGEYKPFKIIEPLIDAVNEEGVALITTELNKLIAQGYFKCRRSPLEIRDQIWAAYRYKSGAWSVISLKDIIYQSIRAGSLIAIKDKGCFRYQV